MSRIWLLSSYLTKEKSRHYWKLNTKAFYVAYGRNYIAHPLLYLR